MAHMHAHMNTHNIEYTNAQSQLKNKSFTAAVDGKHQ